MSYRMTVIHKIGDTIIKKDKKGVYRFIIDEKNQYIFWKLFPWNKLDLITTKLIDNKINIVFKADEVETLSQFSAQKKNQLSYEETLQLWKNISSQLKSLEEEDKSIPFFAPKDILVINRSLFFYINQEKIIPIKDKKLSITYPIKKNNFCSPELCNIKSLPATIPYQAGIYSLATLATFVLTNNTNKDYPLALESIWQTPLYWSLIRCLHKTPGDRVYLII